MSYKDYIDNWIIAGTILILIIAGSSTFYARDYKEILNDNPDASFVVLDRIEDKGYVDVLTHSQRADYVRWKIDEDFSTLYAGRLIVAKERWKVFYYRTYGEDQWVELNRKASLVKLYYTPGSNFVEITRETPYYASGRSGSGGTLYEVFTLGENLDGKRKWHKISANFVPADNRLKYKHKLIWEIERLKGIDETKIITDVPSLIAEESVVVNWMDAFEKFDYAELSPEILKVHFKNQTGIYEIDPSLGVGAAINDHMELISNSEHCFVECEAIVKLSAPFESLPVEDLNISFKRMAGNPLYDYQIEELAEVKVLEEKTIVTGQEEICFGPNSTCYFKDKVVTTQELVTKEEFIPFIQTGKTIETGNSKILKISAKRKADIGPQSVDWQMEFNGFKPAWAWWNASYSNRRTVAVENTDDVAHINELILLDLQNVNSRFSPYRDIALVVNNTTMEDFDFINSTFIAFVPDSDLGASTRLFYWDIYSNGSSIFDNNKSLNFLWDDFENGSLNANTWPQQNDDDLNYTRQQNGSLYFRPNATVAHYTLNSTTLNLKHPEFVNTSLISLAVLINFTGSCTGDEAIRPNIFNGTIAFGPYLYFDDLEVANYVAGIGDPHQERAKPELDPVANESFAATYEFKADGSSYQVVRSNNSDTVNISAKGMRDISNSPRLGFRMQCTTWNRWFSFQEIAVWGENATLYPARGNASVQSEEARGPVMSGWFRNDSSYSSGSIEIGVNITSTFLDLTATVFYRMNASDNSSAGTWQTPAVVHSGGENFMWNATQEVRVYTSSGNFTFGTLARDNFSTGTTSYSSENEWFVFDNLSANSTFNQTLLDYNNTIISSLPTNLSIFVVERPCLANVPNASLELRASNGSYWNGSAWISTASLLSLNISGPTCTTFNSTLTAYFTSANPDLGGGMQFWLSKNTTDFWGINEGKNNITFFTDSVPDSAFGTNISSIKFVPQYPTQTCIKAKNQTSTKCAFNVTNNASSTGTLRIRVNETYTNITIRADDDYTCAGALSLTTEWQNITTGLAADASQEICVWADYDWPNKTWASDIEFRMRIF
jgi:hypothetical protein